MYDIESYYQGETVEETLRLLEEHPEAKIICGGSDVLIKTREGRWQEVSSLAFVI